MAAHVYGFDGLGLAGAHDVGLRRPDLVLQPPILLTTPKQAIRPKCENTERERETERRHTETTTTDRLPRGKQQTK